MNDVKTLVGESIDQALSSTGRNVREYDQQKYEQGNNYDGKTEIYDDQNASQSTDDDGPATFNALQDMLLICDKAVHSQKGGSAATQDAKESKESPDEVISKFEAEMVPMETSEEIDEEMASVCRLLASGGLLEEKVKAVTGTYHPPANRTTICPVKTNQAVWTILPRSAQVLDMKLQRAQALTVKAMIALVQAMNDIKEAARDKPSLNTTFKKLTDCFALMATNTRNQNLYRRDQIKARLNYNYKHICAISVPSTQELFGDKVEHLIKTQTEALKIKQ